MDPISVCNIECLLIWREAQSVWPTEAIGNYPNIGVLWIEAIDLRRQLRLRPNALLKTIDRVGKPNGSVGFHNDVVQRVEATAIVAV